MKAPFKSSTWTFFEEFGLRCLQGFFLEFELDVPPEIFQKLHLRFLQELRLAFIQEFHPGFLQKFFLIFLQELHLGAGGISSRSWDFYLRSQQKFYLALLRCSIWDISTAIWRRSSRVSPGFPAGVAPMMPSEVPTGISSEVPPGTFFRSYDFSKSFT